MTPWFCNGEAAGGLPLDDRAWQYGDGVFETIAIRRGKPRLFDWHVERLATGCRRLGIDAPGEARLRRDLRSSLESADCDTAFALAKIVITAGRGPRGYRRQALAAGHYTGVFAATRLEPSAYRDGVPVRTCSTRLGRQPQLAGIKSLNRLEQVLARSEWHDDTVFEGLTFDTDGLLICGTMSNVFLVDDNQLMTPDLSFAGVAGIMRRKLIETAHRVGIPVSVRAIDSADLQAAGGLFLTNSQYGIVPVRELDGRTIDVDPVTRRLIGELVEDGFEEMAC